MKTTTPDLPDLDPEVRAAIANADPKYYLCNQIKQQLPERVRSLHNPLPELFPYWEAYLISQGIMPIPNSLRCAFIHEQLTVNFPTNCVPIEDLIGAARQGWITWLLRIY